MLSYEELRERTRMPVVAYSCRKCGTDLGMKIPRVCPKCHAPSHGDYHCGKYPQQNVVVPVYEASKPQKTIDELDELLKKASPAQRAVITELLKKL